MEEREMLAKVETGFSALYLDESYCRACVLKALHGNNPHCPRCHGELSAKQLGSFLKNERVKCSACGSYFTALTDTMFSNTRMTFSEIIFLLFFLAQKYRPEWIAERINLDVTSVRIWRRKLNEVVRRHT